MIAKLNYKYNVIPGKRQHFLEISKLVTKFIIKNNNKQYQPDILETEE
jgi:hypothetical protein